MGCLGDHLGGRIDNVGYLGTQLGKLIRCEKHQQGFLLLALLGLPPRFCVNAVSTPTRVTYRIFEKRGWSLHLIDIGQIQQIQ